ncbi:antibiotic biosynthesis monooxygenase [Nocardioides koreensis]|uniref:Antibiotic biosynthesis monooxygenase n=1 Tax=Nocardioides koreensis TaxID=433651 RepID=A0ABN2ZMM7_9ACTN
MYARSTTIMGEPGRLDDGIAYVRDDVLPTVTAMDGCLGLSMLIDRDTGQCIVTSSWDSEEAMQASNLHLAPMRMRGGQIMGGPPEVDEWEVAVMHRDHPAPEGSCCRVTWMRLNHHDIDRGIDLYRAAMLPEMESIDGFCSASLLVNRTLGRACNTTTYDSRAALDASRERSWTIRDAGVRDAGVDVLDVAELDLALAHLRLPELV